VVEEEDSWTVISPREYARSVQTVYSSTVGVFKVKNVEKT